MVQTRNDPGESSNFGNSSGSQGERDRGIPVTGAGDVSEGRRGEPAIVKKETPIPGSAKDIHFEPIGVGKPLLITLESVYLGPHRRGRDVLVTSQVKDPLSIAAGVMSMNMAKYDVEDRALIDVGVDAGSEVIYYSPAVTDDKLNIAVNLKFDGFDRDRIQKVITAGAGIAGLPAFIAGGALAGPVGAASGQAIVQVASAGATLIVSLVDRLLDAKDMVSLDWELNLARTTLEKAKAGWVLLYPATAEQSSTPGQWGSGYTSTQATSHGQAPLTVNSEEFVIGRDGTLRSVKDPDKPFTGDFPYAVVSVNGHAEPKLKKWKPAAVTAGLTARFLQQQSDKAVLGEVSDAFEAYSDVLILRDAKGISDQLVAEKDAKKKEKLQKMLDALITSIQDDALRKVAEGK